MIRYYKEDCKFDLKGKALNNRWLKLVAESEIKKIGDINVIFCSDNYILDVNMKYLQHDYFTDIITFDYCEKNILSGDLFISIDSVKDNAEFYGVDVQLFFQGVWGNQIYNALRLRTEGAGDDCTLAGYMADDVWIGYSDLVRKSMLAKGVNWTEMENRNGTIPNPLGSPMNKENSSRFIEDGSYFRLKNVQIGYTLPKNVTEKFLCSRLRFYVTASNLFTITKYSGYDPEVGSGVDYGNYPQSRTFTFGLNANF